MVESIVGDEDRIRSATEEEEGTGSRWTPLDVAACSLCHDDPAPHAIVYPRRRIAATKSPRPLHRRATTTPRHYPLPATMERERGMVERGGRQ